MLRLLVTPPASGGWNMALDAALLGGVESGAPPVIRFFAWERPTVSLGYAQPPARAVDAEAVAAQAWGLARRPTGGRAVLHWEELTYAVAFSPKDRMQAALFGSDMMMTYRVIAECLVAGLGRVGLGAVLSRSKAGGRLSPTAAGAAPCFASAGRHEVLVASRKLVGSAQRRTAHGVLQHGSVLMGPAHLAIADVLPLDASGRKRARLMLERATISAHEALGRSVTFAEMAGALALGFEGRLGVRLAERELTEAERAAATAGAAARTLESGELVEMACGRTDE